MIVCFQSALSVKLSSANLFCVKNTAASEAHINAGARLLCLSGARKDLLGQQLCHWKVTLGAQLRC